MKLYPPSQSDLDPEFAALGEEFARLSDVFEEHVTLKKWASWSAGNPTAGLARTPVFTDVDITVELEAVSPRDMSLSGGWYQVGDIKVCTESEIKVQTDKLTESDPDYYGGDRIVWRGDTFRIIGPVERHVLLGAPTHYTATMRKL